MHVVILGVLSTPFRYIKSKVESAYTKLVKKQPKKTKNEVYNEENLKRKSIDGLKEIAKLRRIKNSGKLKKGLITSILKSESSNVEHNYMKPFNTDVDNNNADTYGGKIRDKIRDIRAILSRLGDIVTKHERVKIKNELYGIENKKNLSDEEKERIDDNLIKLLNKHKKKEKKKKNIKIMAVMI